MSRLPVMLPLLLAACVGSGTLDLDGDTGVPFDRDDDGYGRDDDCDDLDPDVHPGATEWCNGIDDDCDGQVDEDAADASTWLQDADGDGHGDDATAVASCEPMEGRVQEGGDCDDGEPGVHPGAEEICDGVDQDCDGEIDEDAVDAPTWYPDADGDGYGDSAAGVTACEAPEGWISDGTDCDDTRRGVHPGAVEECDGADTDCSGDLHWLEGDADADGWLACEEVAWVSTDDSAYNDPDSEGRYGSSEVAELLDDRGQHWVQVSLEDVGLSRALLERTGMVVLQGQATHGPLSDGESRRLQAWIESGGTLLLFTGWHSEATCALLDSLPGDLGLSCGGGAWSGQATDITPHDITAGVRSVCVVGAEDWDLASPARAVVAEGSYPAVVVAELGEGRVVGITDEWMLYNAGTGQCDLGWGDHERLVGHVLDWLLARPM